MHASCFTPFGDMYRRTPLLSQAQLCSLASMQSVWSRPAKVTFRVGRRFKSKSAPTDESRVLSKSMGQLKNNGSTFAIRRLARKAASRVQQKEQAATAGANSNAVHIIPCRATYQSCAWVVPTICDRVFIQSRLFPSEVGAAEPHGACTTMFAMLKLNVLPKRPQLQNFGWKNGYQLQNDYVNNYQRLITYVF